MMRLCWTALLGTALLGAAVSSANKGGIRRGREVVLAETTAGNSRELQGQRHRPTYPYYTAEQILDLATEYVGGKDALMALTTVVIESTGETNMIFEGELPPELTKSSDYERVTTLNFAEDKIRVDESLDPFFEAFAFFPVQNSTRVVDGNNIGFQDRQTLLVAAGTMSSSSVAALKRQQFLFNPHQLLQRGHSQPGRMFLRPGKWGKHVLGFRDDVYKIMLVVNKRGRITRLRTMEANPLIRDTKITVKYTGWDLVGDDGIKFPRSVSMSVGNYGTMWTDDRTSVVTNPTDLPDDTFDLPNGTDTGSFDPELYEYGLQTHHVEEGFRNLGFSYSQPRYAPGVELAPGVYWLQSRISSMVICHGEGVILQEAPYNSVVADRLLSAAAELCGPGQPVTHLVQTHFHLDHSSGSRQVVATTGADFVIGKAEGLKEFWESSVFAAESRIRPDRQQELGNPIPNVVEVPEQNGDLVLVSGEVTVTVFDTTRDPHVEGATITTVESAGRIFVYEADMYAAGFGGTLTLGGPQGFFSALRDHNLIDENCSSALPMTIVPAHGFVQSLEDSLAELEGLGVDVGCPPQ